MGRKKLTGDDIRSRLSLTLPTRKRERIKRMAEVRKISIIKMAERLIDIGLGTQ